MDASLVSIGVVLLITGIGALILLWAGIRIARRQGDYLSPTGMPSISADLASSNDAIIVARTGGRIVFANNVTRKLFDSVTARLICG